MEQTPKADWKAILAILLCGLVWAGWMQMSFTRNQAAAALQKKKLAALAASSGALALSTTPLPPATGGVIAATVGQPALVAAPAAPPPEIVTLSNKVLDLKISSHGARPIAANLKEFKSNIDSQDAGLVQLVATSDDGIAPLQAWFGDLTTNRIPADAPFEKVSSAGDQAVFRYVGAGLTVTRTFATRENDYLVNLTEVVENSGTAPLTGRPGVVWSANMRNTGVRSTAGDFEAVAYVGNQTQRGVPAKIGDKSISTLWLSPAKVNEEWRYGGKVDWVGIGDRYFVASILPLDPAFDTPEDVRIFHPGVHSIAALAVGPQTTLDPQGSKTFEYQLYLGPKNFKTLQAAAPGRNLGETIYWGYAFLEPLAKGFLWFLQQVHGIVGNWGWAIIVLTLIVRGALSPLAAKQMRSSQEFAAKSQRLKPQLERLKEKHADDAMALNRETMLLYKQHGLSPFSPVIGCLPMLAQLPVWWALYKVLWGAIELRQAPFGLWIHDLAAPDPYKILPVLLGAVTFVQTKLTPQAPGTDPAQQKMMLYTMPIVFTMMMLGLPSGLVLYIFTSTLMNIGQQYYLRRKYPMNPPPAPVVTAQREAT